MKDYLKINIDELDDTKQRYKEICDELESIEKIVSSLINEFARENNGETANKIVEIMENYETIITTNFDLFDELHDSVDEFLDLIDEVLKPSSYDDIILDLEDLGNMRNELKQVLDDPMSEIEFNISNAEEAIVEEINYLKRKRDNFDIQELRDKERCNEQIRDLKYNKELLKDLRQDLKKILNFEDEFEQIDVEIEQLNEFASEEAKLSVAHIEETLSELQAFKLEVNITALNALLPEPIKSDMMEQVLEKLDIPDKQQLIDQINELKQAGLFDNFYANVKNQVEVMGLEAFLKNPDRIKWLAINPRYHVNSFQSNLTPEQLRLLTEEVAYLLFHNDPDPRHPEFQDGIFNMLELGVGKILINKEKDNEFTMEVEKRFADAGLVFEAVESPSGESPWYIQEKGLEACVMRINGEIVIMYPGSQEIKEDWIDTNLVPNLTHQVPEQYQIASDFAAEVKAAYPDDNIVLSGHSLAGGAVSYAGAQNDMNSFAIDPAPSVEGKDYPEYDKGITVIPGGKFGGILNNAEVGKDGYYQSDTDIDIVDVAAGAALAASVVAEVNSASKPPRPAIGPLIYATSKYAQNNDTPAGEEGVYINSLNEKTDIDDSENIGYRDEYKGYLGDHMAGYLDSGLENGYLPYN